jgi:hypothetical protein
MISPVTLLSAVEYVEVAYSKEYILKIFVPHIEAHHFTIFP